MKEAGNSKTEPEKIVRRKLSDQVFERLRAMIGSELKPGDTLPSERDLMQRYGVGRPAIREALQSLQSKGLITIAHGERSRVNVLTPDLAAEQMNEIARVLLSIDPTHLEHLKQARKLFETGIVRIAAQNATADDIAELRELVAEQREQEHDASTFVALDMRFHGRIAAMTGNPIIATVCDALLRWLFEYHRGLLHWSGKENVTLSEHEKIVDFLEVNDGDGAVVAMRSHLDRTEAFYIHRK